MAKRYPKVYVGSNSVAKIPIKGEVDTRGEVLKTAFALAYDIADKKVLTHVPNKVKKATIQTINGRFLVLRRLAKKFSNRLYSVIDKLHSLAVKFLNGKISRRTYLSSVNVLAYGLLHGKTLSAIRKRVR